MEPVLIQNSNEIRASATSPVFCGLMSSLEMLLSDWLYFLDKTILALSGGHFEDFFTFSKKYLHLFKV
jgi:hypothetical protein